MLLLRRCRIVARTTRRTQHAVSKSVGMSIGARVTAEHGLSLVVVGATEGRQH